MAKTRAQDTSTSHIGHTPHHEEPPIKRWSLSLYHPHNRQTSKACLPLWYSKYRCWPRWYRGCSSSLWQNSNTRMTLLFPLLLLSPVSDLPMGDPHINDLPVNGGLPHHDEQVPSMRSSEEEKSKGKRNTLVPCSNLPKRDPLVESLRK